MSFGVTSYAITRNYFLGKSCVCTRLFFKRACFLKRSDAYTMEVMQIVYILAIEDGIDVPGNCFAKSAPRSFQRQLRHFVRIMGAKGG